MIQNPKITVGITTYNRKNILEMMAKSFYESDLSGAEIHIRIYDDRSSEFDRLFLEQLFPTATSIRINETNLKSDLNIYSMYKDFLTTDDDYFFNADSDLIFRKDWLQFVLQNFDKTDGILSIFNTDNHKTVSIEDNLPFVKKNDIGSAGTFLSRDRMKQIISWISEKENLHLDWEYCAKFIKEGFSIYCSKESYVQHIGLVGQNSFCCVDYGKQFKVDSFTNGQIINDLMLDIMKISSSEVEKFMQTRLTQIAEEHASLMIKSSLDYKLGNILLSPLRFLKGILKN